MADYVFGAGKVYFGERDGNGNATGLKWAGDCDSFNTAFATEKKERKEKYSGQNMVAATVNTGKSATANIRLAEFKIDQLAMAMYGKKVSQATGSVADEVIATTLPSAGELLLLSKQNVSDLVIKDSAGSPATLVAGTHYRENLAHGSIEVISMAGFTAPIEASFDFGATQAVAMFASTPANKWIRYEGVNLANGKEVVVDLYNVRINPLKELATISDDFASLEIEADVLIDQTKTAEGDLGQFGRIIFVG